MNGINHDVSHVRQVAFETAGGKAIKCSPRPRVAHAVEIDTKEPLLQKRMSHEFLGRLCALIMLP